MTPRTTLTAIGAAALLLALAGCVPNNPVTTTDESATSLTVDSSADACTVSAATAPSGTLSFSVTNSGDEVTEFYLLADDGLRIVGEVENIGPGIERTLVVVAKPGDYFTVCKPGMVGAGIGQSAFTVTDSGVDLADSDIAEQVEIANANYKSYVKDQVENLVTGTEDFAAAYIAGDDDTARALYAPTRVFWERI